MPKNTDIEKILQDAAQSVTTTIATPEDEDLKAFIAAAEKMKDLAIRHNWPTIVAAFAPVSNGEERGMAAMVVNHVNPSSCADTFSVAKLGGVIMAMAFNKVFRKNHELHRMTESVLK